MRWVFDTTMLRIVFLFIWLSVYLQTGSATGGDPADPQSLTELQSRIDSLVREESIPGAAVALVSKDSIIWIGTFGLAHVASGRPVTENTHFCLGSCTKSFVGLGFLQLVEEGKIDLNTRVKDIAPEIAIDNPWEDTYPVRVVHLLEHTAGFDDMHLNWFYFTGPALPLQRALEIKADLRKVRWPPGTRVGYSSPGYTLAGYILGRVAGQRYEDYLKQAVLEPMGMITSTIGRAAENTQLLAAGYGNNREPIPYWYDYDEPAGAMNSSITEMALFVRCMLNRGRAGTEQVIAAELIDRVGKPTTTLAARAGLAAGYSFGITTRFRDTLKAYGHGGAVPGFFADYAWYPDHSLGYVVLLNEFGSIYHDDIFDLVQGYLTRDMRATSVPAVPVPAKRLETYCGYYEPRSPRMQLFEFAEIMFNGRTILLENDTLYEQDFMSEKKPLIPVSQKLFRRANHPQASRVFTVLPDGGMMYATTGSYYEKTAGWKPILYRLLFFGALLVMVSAIAYAVFWIPVHLYKKLKNIGTRSPYLRMRIIPLFAVGSLVLGFIAVADQTILELGQPTVRNVLFFLCTLIFAGLSVLSLFIAGRSVFHPVKKTARVYAVLLSSVCLGMTLYLGYWGLIGLRLWAY